MNLGGVIHLNRMGVCVVIACVLILFIYMFPRDTPVIETEETRPIDLKMLLSLSIEAARKGGDQILQVKDDVIISNKGKTKEGANDSVTNADYKSHIIMMETLKHGFPNLNIISEEGNMKGEHSQLSSHELEVINEIDSEFFDPRDITVWIDPLDATQEFTEKLYQYVTTMVCVVVRGRPTIGIIYEVFNNNIYWAWVGNGKSSNLKRPASNEGTMRFIVSRSHSGKVREELEKHFDKFSIIEAGGAGYKVLELIKGNADSYVHVTAIKKWDICAGNAILEALGGHMTTKANKEIDYSDTKHFENSEGLVASLENHERYVNKF